MAPLPRWSGDPRRPLLSWLSVPGGATDLEGAIGAVVLPPVGYEYWSAHRTLRELAELLAGAGCACLRPDYDGTGDSAGDQWDPGRLERWKDSVSRAVEELRALGCAQVVLVGLRLGGALALLEGARVGADAVVAWSPVVSGRRYRRELEMLATPVPDGHPRPAAEGGVVLAGFAFSQTTLEDLRSLDVARLGKRPAPRALLVERPERPEISELAEILEGLGCRTSVFVAPGTERFLDRPAEDAVVPRLILKEICAFVAGLGPGDGPSPRRHTEDEPRAGGESAGSEALARRGPVRLDWQGKDLTEEAISLGAQRLCAIETLPLAPSPLRMPTVVFLNSGSEPHVGPGRAWVELARGLAAAGIPAVRADFPGWGESPDPAVGVAPGRPYDAHTVEDTRSLSVALRRRGHDRLVLVGLCAGAWVALRAVLEEPVLAVVAINPQLYWQPGDAVIALLSKVRELRTPERRREELGRRTGLWSALDLVGLCPPAGRWLTELARSTTAVLLLFAEGDDGLEYLENRLGRRLRRAVASGGLHVQEMAGIDHPMHREWLRPLALAAIESFVTTLASPSQAQRAGDSALALEVASHGAPV